MFHSRENKINRIHERTLRITYNDKSSSFGELLNKYNSVTIHHRNVRALAIEIYKSRTGLSPPLLNDNASMQFKEAVQGNKFLERRRDKSEGYGTESLSLLAPKIWEKYAMFCVAFPL